jgi:hypothetical protein
MRSNSSLIVERKDNQTEMERRRMIANKSTNKQDQAATVHLLFVRAFSRGEEKEPDA